MLKQGKRYVKARKVTKIPKDRARTAKTKQQNI